MYLSFIKNSKNSNNIYIFFEFNEFYRLNNILHAILNIYANSEIVKSNLRSSAIKI